MANKSYSVNFLVLETSTNIMKDHCVSSTSFSVLELKHRLVWQKTWSLTWYLYLRYQWSHFQLLNQEC